MSSFHLQIVTPDGLFYDGQAESLNLRAAQSGRVGGLLLHKNIPFPVRKKRDRVLLLEFCTNGRCLPHFSAAARNRQDFPALFYSFVTLPLPADTCIAKTYLTTGLKAGMMASS